MRFRGCLALAVGLSSPVLALGSMQKPAPKESPQAAIDRLVPPQPVVAGRLMSLPDVPHNDVHHALIAEIRAEINKKCMTCHATPPGASPRIISILTGPVLGFEATPADATLREQLDLGKRGLVVTSVTPGGRAKDLKVRDLILTAGGKDVANLAELHAAFRASAHEPTKLSILREGEPREVEIAGMPGLNNVVSSTRVVNVTGPKRYWIGVTLNTVDATLRSQLKLGAKLGVVVTDVIKEGPASKGGLKSNDILLRAGETPITGSDDLVKAVQDAREKPVKLSIRRAGKELTVTVTPEERVEDASVVGSPWTEQLLPYGPSTLMQYGFPANGVQGLNTARTLVGKPLDSQAALDRIELQIQELSKQIQDLKGAMPEPTAKP